MRFKGTKISKRTLALLASAIILLGGSGVAGTRAALTVISPEYDAEIVLDELQVALTENGSDVADGGELLTSLKDTKIEPGKTYDDAIGVRNNGGANEYVRVIVRRYWTDDKGNKSTDLSPDMIELNLANDNWTEVAGGSDETKIYYYKHILETSGQAALFDSIRVSDAVATDKEVKEDSTTDGDTTKTTITYVYRYNGYSFNVEAEAQAVQTHNGTDAIKSIWGVDASDVGISIEG